MQPWPSHRDDSSQLPCYLTQQRACLIRQCSTTLIALTDFTSHGALHPIRTFIDQFSAILLLEPDDPALQEAVVALSVVLVAAYPCNDNVCAALLATAADSLIALAPPAVAAAASPTFTG